MFVLAYTAVRVGELLRDPNDQRRRGVRWEDLSLDDGSMDVYRKKRQWDVVSLPDPVNYPTLLAHLCRVGVVAVTVFHRCPSVWDMFI